MENSSNTVSVNELVKGMSAHFDEGFPKPHFGSREGLFKFSTADATASNLSIVYQPGIKRMGS
jgi:hypothetical protein